MVYHGNVHGGKIKIYNPFTGKFLVVPPYWAMTMDRKPINLDSIVNYKWEEMIDPCIWIHTNYMVTIAPEDVYQKVRQPENALHICWAVNKYKKACAKIHTTAKKVRQ